MELRHLRYFVTLAEELHFGRAAERLHIAQPPLSQQIRQLEGELGFELFYRTKRKVQLTEAGQVFLGEVLQIMRQLQQAIQIGRQTSRGEIGQLIVGFVSSAAYNILPTILRTFRSCVPGVSIELHELTTDQQLEWLREGRMDVGLLRPPVEENRFSCETIFQESLMVALPEAHLLASQSNVCLTSLANEPFILFPRILAPGLYDLIISLCQQAGFSPKVAQEAIQMQTIVSLVAAEMGVAIVPASLQNLQRIGVVYKTLQEPTPKVAFVADVGAAIAMIWRNNETSPTVLRLVEIVRQAAQQW
ncbi:LysR family transcriptional regulator [Nostoc sp. 'Peltigera membranacea cyanobiont' N6]|uniref:LysR family transcriptional regulator n=1 Tax=Nostoc sp. 'Peltigera membranacea cyanobiont' N6 TaxID=1261031 RepID=UPI000CF32BAB|nr:LysR family transcriptional regulator [Nostoc sp. 'Peltigera membranacea cyanobiont' N6]AVH63079.1 LysR family transcriptional regulator [Nostoc sp. 'Peltigera membranacea cyanobiont' N6]